ncbi:hypothetical protein R3W88_031853 [Solanum pinnatisectum]|uniref:Uncharacterized protein n=1 Tax=Solanum pinnatisectum TaxID=50273 RepID=A0AAV9LMH8_9SOLN|nr:hypothetical protein R3W88_031853 [Solanum pinnatisectum]
MARCYIFTSMVNVLQHQHQSMTYTYDMLEPLKEIFREKNRFAKLTTIKALLTTKMVIGSFFREHLINMMSCLNELEILSTVIDKES